MHLYLFNVVSFEDEDEEDEEPMTDDIFLCHEQAFSRAEFKNQVKVATEHVIQQHPDRLKLITSNRTLPFQTTEIVKAMVTLFKYEHLIPEQQLYFKETYLPKSGWNITQKEY